MDSRSLDLFVKILLETDEIEERLHDFRIDAELWKSSRPMRDLILMPLIQIGELTTHFKSNEHLTLFPEIPWREIKGFRNIVVYGYGQIGPDIAWNTATAGVAELRTILLGDADIVQAYELERSHREAACNDVEALDDICAFINGLPDADR